MFKKEMKTQKASLEKKRTKGYFALRSFCPIGISLSWIFAALSFL